MIFSVNFVICKPFTNQTFKTTEFTQIYSPNANLLWKKTIHGTVPLRAHRRVCSSQDLFRRFTYFVKKFRFGWQLNYNISGVVQASKGLIYLSSESRSCCFTSLTSHVLPNFLILPVVLTNTYLGSNKSKDVDKAKPISFFFILEVG